MTLQAEVTSLIVALWGSLELYGNEKMTKRERKKRLKSWIKVVLIDFQVLITV